jgi:endonuclease-3
MTNFCHRVRVFNDFDYLFTTLEQNTTRLSEPFTDAFQVLIFCIVSLRTRDTITYKVVANLFSQAATAECMAQLSADQIAALIYPCAFFKRKAQQILTICVGMVNKGQRQPPHTLKELLELPGVGLKTANITLARGHGIDAICVDIHVHRICNRLGLISSTTPDQSEALLRAVMPRKWWIKSNELLVYFGQQCCKPINPRCKQCFLKEKCPKNGVKSFG